MVLADLVTGVPGLPLPDFVAVGDMVMEGIHTLLTQWATMVHQEGALVGAQWVTNNRTGTLVAQGKELTIGAASVIAREAAVV